MKYVPSNAEELQALLDEHRDAIEVAQLTAELQDELVSPHLAVALNPAHHPLIRLRYLETWIVKNL